MNAVKPTEVMPRCRGTDELETSMSFTGTQLKMQQVQAAMKKILKKVNGWLQDAFLASRTGI